MSLPTDLLAQAKFLSAKEPRRPKQASLRRAVSAAYYALFHRLISEGAKSIVSGSHSAPLRNLTGRAFEHASMKRACKAFSSMGIPPDLQTGLPNGVPSEIQKVAEIFLMLQAMRHEADYNLSLRLSRSETNDLIAEADHAFRLWEKVRKTDAAKTFLLSLLLWKQWSRR